MLKELKPSSLKDEKIDALLSAFDGVFPEVFDKVVNVLIYPRIDELSGEILDLLGWQFHIEGWELARTEEEKRELIKKAIDLHRLKGTLAGLKFGIGLAGGKLLKILLPWDRIYLSKSLTAEERADFYKLYPELRITRIAFRGKTYYKANKFYIRAYKPYTSDAETRYGMRAYIYKNGTLTPLKTQEKKVVHEEKEAVKVIEIRQKGSAKGHFGRPKDRFLVNHSARKRTYTLQVRERYTDVSVKTQTKIAYPSMSPLSVYYETVYEKGTRPKNYTYTDFLYGHTSPTSAYKRIYYKLHLYDEDVALQHRKAIAFLDAKPIRVPAFHALAKVEIVSKAFPLRNRFPGKQPKKKLEDICRLITNFKPLRDKVLIDTKTKTLITADGQITAGQKILCGGFINA
jgi:hypothetical protein